MSQILNTVVPIDRFLPVVGEVSEHISHLCALVAVLVGGEPDNKEDKVGGC